MVELKKVKKKKSSVFIYTLLIIGFFIGAGVLFYPTISELWNTYRNKQLASDYQQAVEELSEEDYSAIWAEARAYNESHTVNTIVDAFNEEDNDYILTHPYDQLLNPNGDEVMGYLEIAKINVYLPIYHGAGAVSLENGVGHIEGTSLPIGGEGTHAVLSAHRGLPSAKLFSDLDQMEEGDVFLLHILDETLAYEVDQILTVLPTETESLMLEEGKDLVTLVTCTPYGVNTHRLLVRGHRVEYVPEEMDSDDSLVLRNPLEGSRSREQTLLVIGIMALIVFFMILNVALSIKDRKRRNDQE